MNEKPFTHMKDLTPDQIIFANRNWDNANQFINEMVLDHLLHMEGGECEIPCCSSEEFVLLLDGLSDNQAKAVAHAAIVRLSMIFKESTDV